MGYQKDQIPSEETPKGVLMLTSEAVKLWKDKAELEPVDACVCMGRENL
jgi:hypothetical protein